MAGMGTNPRLRGAGLSAALHPHLSAEQLAARQIGVGMQVLKQQVLKQRKPAAVQSGQMLQSPSFPAAEGQEACSAQPHAGPMPGRAAQTCIHDARNPAVQHPFFLTPSTPEPTACVAKPPPGGPRNTGKTLFCRFGQLTENSVSHTRRTDGTHPIHMRKYMSLQKRGNLGAPTRTAGHNALKEFSFLF